MEARGRKTKAEDEALEQSPPAAGTEPDLVEAPSEAGTEVTAHDELALLRQELESSKARECEYLDGWQRARAELSNARKRFQRDQEQAYANAQADVLVRILPILDDLERAFETLPRNLSGLTWIEGVLLIHRKLQLLLEQAGVKAIDSVGQPFDPFAHQAVTHEPSDTVPDGSVIAELQKGYRLGDRVLRPCMVRVSSGTPESESLRPQSAPPAPEDREEAPTAG